MSMQRERVPFDPRRALVAAGVGVSTLGTVMVDGQGRPGMAVVFLLARNAVPTGPTEPIAFSAEMAAGLIANIMNTAERDGYGAFLQAEIDQALAQIRADVSADPMLGTIGPAGGGGE